MPTTVDSANARRSMRFFQHLPIALKDQMKKVIEQTKEEAPILNSHALEQVLPGTPCSSASSSSFEDDVQPPTLQKDDKQLTERTDILECAWHKRQEDGHRSEDDDDDDDDEEHAGTESAAAEHGFQAPAPRVKTFSIGDDWFTRERSPNEFQHISRWRSLTVYLSWVTLIIFAYVREFLRSWGIETSHIKCCLISFWDFVPLFNDFEAVYQRNCYVRVRDVFERPIGSVPGSTVQLLDRYTQDGGWTFKFTGKQTQVINVGSYNYLGFAQNEGPCAKASIEVIDKEGLSSCSTVHENGRSASQDRLEKLVAEFLGVESAICFSMGFATNSMNAPCLVDKNSLIVSDQYNHASLILGCRLSGASTKVFKHNDMKSLEKILRDAIAYGNPKTHRPYKKILIIVEGIYSMEGSISNLPGIIELKKKYGAYLYLDEAHSIGAMGRSGKGCVEYWGCNPNDVDILMGTFTKSFGSAGGYIAGSKRVIDHLRVASPTGYYSSPMSPPIAEQIYSAMSIIMGRDGSDDGRRRIERLARNSRYFRLRLKQLGYIVYGSDDSPVVPVLIYYPTIFYGRQMLARGIGVVVVSFPATDMTEARVRFCVSAAHTKEQIDIVLNAMAEVGKETWCSTYSDHKHLYENMKIEW